MSFSTVDHLRWDLNQIFETAIVEGITDKNPAALLFTPEECPKPEHPTMGIEDVRLAFTVLPLRDRLIMKLAILSGDTFQRNIWATLGSYPQQIRRYSGADISWTYRYAENES